MDMFSAALARQLHRLNFKSKISDPLENLQSESISAGLNQSVSFEGTDVVVAGFSCKKQNKTGSYCMIVNNEEQKAEKRAFLYSWLVFSKRDQKRVCPVTIPVSSLQMLSLGC